nr:unnamed protein product [Digitaria exilis]
MAATVEEQMMVKAIREESPWEALPKRIQAALVSKEEWHRSIPNFSAADALRITGVGRNEFIDIMNKCRSKKIMWKLNKSIAKELLPTEPADLAIEPWWGVRFVNFTLEEFKKLSEDETSAIDKICKEEVNSYVLFDPEVIQSLYRRGMVYFDVPVYSDDRFRVSRLEGFVSNKDQSYEDPIEELLYAVFVVSSENATVAELATTLQADLYQLQAAASFACRLGWAVKLLDTDSVLKDSSTSALSSNILMDDDEASRTSLASEKSGHELLSSDSDGHKKNSGTAYVGFVVDANSVRKRLRELCSEYQATGATARLFNQRGGSKNNSPRKLVNIVSGRWSPFHDPSTPPHPGSPSEHDKAKPARRQRCFTEVLSFDGSILRSYALTPVYEAATRSVSEEQPSTPSAKLDHDDGNTKDVALPGVNMLFDGAELHPFDIVACLQARQPLSLIAEASATSLAMK